MITAKEAHFRTKHQKKVDEVLHQCEDAIEAAIKDGEFHATCSVPVSLDDAVFDAVDLQLTENEYRVTITDHRHKDRNAPCDQGYYYEDIRICWGGEEESAESEEKSEEEEIYCTECGHFEDIADDARSWFGARCKLDGHESAPSMYAIQSLHKYCPLKKKEE